MAFKIRRASYHAVKNPVFSLAERACATLNDPEANENSAFLSSCSTGSEAAILKRRKTKQDKEDEPIVANNDDTVDGGSTSQSNLQTTNATLPAAELTLRKGLDSNSEQSSSSTSSRRGNYEEIAKGRSAPISPRLPATEEGGSPRVAMSSPWMISPHDEDPGKAMSSSSSSSSLLPLRDGTDKSRTSPTPPASFLPKLLCKSTLPMLFPIAKGKSKPTPPLNRKEYKEPEPKPKPKNALKNQEEVCDAINVARQTSDYQTLITFFANMYSSFPEVLKVLKLADDVKSNAESETSSLKLNVDYLDHLHESMVRMPKEVRKTILRSIINCMLQDHRGKKTIDDVRGFLVFLLNPLFSDSSTYVIYAHVLRQISVLDNTEQQYFIMLLKLLPLKDFQSAITRLRGFINYKLFPTKNDIPEGEKSGWWIPNGVKVLALLNAANDQCVPLLVPRKTFYVKSVAMLDLIRQYHLWESGSQTFSFCQYPFVLPLSAKRMIIQKDSETKMLLEARQSLLYKFRQKQVPNMGLLFLNLRIRRKFLLEDSLREISRNQGDLKKKLRVVFTGEPGIDLGGVSKEWFFLITQRFFNEDYGMFTHNTKTRQWWFSMSCKENNQEYNLCGVLLGLAMYNGINLDIRFPMTVYKKLLSPAIVPYNNPHQPVGITKFQLEDFIDIFPDLGNGLKELLSYDGNVEEDLCQSFMVSFTEYGQMITRYLRPDGDKIPVTNENREEYVNLYINYMMNKSIYKQFYSFYHGFHSVCASNALLLLRPEEVETLVIGDPDFNMSDLEKITAYDGYSRSDATIRHFWEAAHDFNMKMKKKFLRFCTGNDRIPVGGMKEMKFKITRVTGANATQMLPIAHTCFNQLCLPPYKSRKLLLRKISIAVENAEGFGLE